MEVLIILVLSSIFSTCFICTLCGFLCRCRRRKGDSLLLEKENRKSCCSMCTLPRDRNVKPEVRHEKYMVDRTDLRRLLHCASCIFFNGCIDCDFKSKLSISDAISRYNEFSDQQQQVGENVFTKLKADKMLVMLLEILNSKAPNFFFKILPSGSLREGFGKFKPSTSILATDYDLMLIPDGVAVEEDVQRDTDSRTPTIFKTVTNTNDIPPGYLWLKLESDGLSNWNPLCFKRLSDDGKRVENYLSQVEVYSLIRSNFSSEKEISFFASRSYDASSISVNVKRSGPALNVLVKGVDPRKPKKTSEAELLDADFTFALYCPKLPDVTRKRLEVLKDCPWPGLEVINEIGRIGCHVVPKASQQALSVVNEKQPINSHLESSSALEFRYSYSQAELLLAEKVPVTFRRCYMAFKALIKFHINNCPDRTLRSTWGKFHEIPSYVLKTTLFWMLSEVGPSAYDNNEGECLLQMVSRLRQYILQRSCPMFWNCQINLLENLSHDDFQFIEDKLNIMTIRECDSLKMFLLDDWLELQRCIRLNCCTNCIPEDKYSTIIMIDKTPCGCQKQVKLSYDEWGRCGPMVFDESAMGVY